MSNALEFATSMQEGLRTIDTNPNMEIYCSDYWLMPWSADDSQPEQKYIYWDHRVTSEVHNSIDFTGSKGICRDDTSSHYAWVNPYLHKGKPNSKESVSVLTPCDDWVSTWTEAYQRGETFASIAGTTFDLNAKSLDQYQASIFSSVLLHELSHAPAIVGESYMLDEHCNVDGSQGAAYGWNCITHLAKNSPGDAINNADSFAYFITAMYLQNNDWSTGKSVPLVG